MTAPRRHLRAVMAALTPGAAGFSELMGALREKDWEHVIAIANHHFVTPTLYRNLRDADLLPILPAEVAEFLQHVYRLNEQRNARILAQLTELLAALDGDGVQCLLLKGAADLPALPGMRLGERIMSDLDVLIRPDDLEHGRALLRRLGYSWDGNDSSCHSDGEYLRPGEPAGIDLHLQIQPEDELLPTAGVWFASVRQRRNGLTFRVPCPEHRLIHLVLHDMLHHHGYYKGALRLRPLHDIGCFVGAWHDRLDWATIGTHFERFRLEPVLEAHLLAAHRYLGAPWPWQHPPSRAARFAVLRFTATANGALPRILLYVFEKASRGLAWHRVHRLYAALWRLCHLDWTNS